MDKKNFILGILCLFAAMFLMRTQNGNLEKQIQRDNIKEKTSSKKRKNSLIGKKESKKGSLRKIVEKRPAKIFTLDNGSLHVEFTTKGGAINKVGLKKYPADLKTDKPYLVNDGVNIPALDLYFGADLDAEHELLDYQITKADKNFIQFHSLTEYGLEIIRGYRLAEKGSKNPYLISHEVLVRNNGEKALNLHRAHFNIGTFPATKGDNYGEYLNFGYYDGKKDRFIKAREFDSSNGFLGFGSRAEREYISENGHSLKWGSVKNQFFASVLTPEEPAYGFFAQPFKFSGKYESLEGINAYMTFKLGALRQGEEKLFSMNYYVGPKDYLLLSKMGENQDLIMQFGFFGGVSKVLLLSMKAINSFISNWGLTIIILTVIIKLLMWPLTRAQVRSAKKMADLQGPLKALKEKYKNNAQKVQVETMKLFKEHKVNPAMGCLPLLIQLPIFLGLYFMLRTSSEMRFQKFLWIQDLSVPDTMAHWGTFPVNILPLLMGVTMFLQMKSTPSPAGDNGVQQKMLKLMPIIFLVFCYNFPAALVLYWTVQNVLTIVQQKLTKKN